MHMHNDFENLDNLDLWSLTSHIRLQPDDSLCEVGVQCTDGVPVHLRLVDLVGMFHPEHVPEEAEADDTRFVFL